MLTVLKLIIFFMRIKHLKHFASILPLVMGPIMKTASLKPEVALLDYEELGGVDTEQKEWQFISLGDQQNFRMKTAGMGKKSRFIIFLGNKHESRA